MATSVAFCGLIDRFFDDHSSKVSYNQRVLLTPETERVKVEEEEEDDDDADADHTDIIWALFTAAVER